MDIRVYTMCILYCVLILVSADTLFKQTAERYANPWHHYEPFWYFAEIIGMFWLPFSLSFFSMYASFSAPN